MKKKSRFRFASLFLALAFFAVAGVSTAMAGKPAPGSHGGLMAGAGSSPIVFDTAMFPLEGFNGVVHDNPYARVLVLENNGVKVAICALELVNASPVVDLCKTIVSDATGTPIDNVWIHATHAITTPHLPGDSHHSPGEEAKAVYYIEAIEDAITAAAEQAADTFQPAVAGIGTGTCDVNMNRDVRFPNGKWYMGLGSKMASNKEMTVLRVNSRRGRRPIGFLISYGIKPTCIDNSEMGAGTRQISSDVPGLACRLMEKTFHAPALFFMSAAGDQVPSKWALYDEWDEDTSSNIKVDLGVETGLEFVQELGTIMGMKAKRIAAKIRSRESDQVIDITAGEYTCWTNPLDRNGNPVAQTEVTVPVGAIRFGDAAFVGFQPELNAVSEQQLWTASPYAHTLLISFVNGDAHYMPDASAHALRTTEWMRSGFEPGAAELLVDTATELLYDLK